MCSSALSFLVFCKVEDISIVDSTGGSLDVVEEDSPARLNVAGSSEVLQVGDLVLYRGMQAAIHSHGHGMHWGCSVPAEYNTSWPPCFVRRRLMSSQWRMSSLEDGCHDRVHLMHDRVYMIHDRVYVICG